MKPFEVLVLRHGIAAERNPVRWPDDALRPLTRRGRVKLRKAAAGLAGLLEPPEEVWSSPLQRARETAGIVGTRAAWPTALISESLRPGASAASLGAKLEVRRRAADAPRRLALVGHEPSLSRFLGWAVGTKGGDNLVLRKGGAALLEFPASVHAGGARLVWFATPRMLRALRRRARR